MKFVEDWMNRKVIVVMNGILIGVASALSGCGSGDQPAGQEVVATSRPEFAPASAPAALPSLKKVGAAYVMHPDIPKQTLASGLEIQDVTIGQGDSPRRGDQVTVDYTGWLANGKVFDSSKNGGKPFSFKLGRRKVIAGWEEGVLTMKLGGKRILTIPPGLAHGSGGFGDKIPPDSTLVFEIELLGINDKSVPSKVPSTQVGPQLPQPQRAPLETQPATVPAQQATGPMPQ
jgi:hypothetical protein